MAFVKGQDTLKYFRKRARDLVKGKGRLLTFALVIPDKGGDAPSLRAYYGALGEDGSPAVHSEEEAI